MKPFFMDERKRYRNNFSPSPDRLWDKGEKTYSRRRADEIDGSKRLPSGKTLPFAPEAPIELPSYMEVEIDSDGNKVFFYPKVVEMTHTAHHAPTAKARLCKRAGAGGKASRITRGGNKAALKRAASLPDRVQPARAWDDYQRRKKAAARITKLPTPRVYEPKRKVA